MSYTLGQAAKATGKSKTTIRRYVEKGKISGAKNNLGEWTIDPAELHRVLPPLAQQHSDSADEVARSITPPVTPATELELARTKARLEAIEAQLEDVKQDRDHWRQQATALLTDQRPRGFALLRLWPFRKTG